MSGTTRGAVRTVRCPACGGVSAYAPENRYRPFCSARCKGHDLGAWASEQFRLSDENDPGAGRASDEAQQPGGPQR